jgi:predicted small secreted protein
MRCTTPALILAITAALALSACNTISGAGRDVSSVGKAVTRTANDVKN